MRIKQRAELVSLLIAVTLAFSATPALADSITTYNLTMNWTGVDPPFPSTTTGSFTLKITGTNAQVTSWSINAPEAGLFDNSNSSLMLLVNVCGPGNPCFELQLQKPSDPLEPTLMITFGGSPLTFTGGPILLNRVGGFSRVSCQDPCLYYIVSGGSLPIPPPPTPEPASLILLGTGTMAIGWRLRRGFTRHKSDLCEKKHMKLIVRTSLLVVCLGLAASSAMGSFLPGTTLVSPGTSGVPGLVPSGTNPGTLLASLTDPYSFSTTAGTTSGTLITAVYRNSSGTLDFWYQVANNGSSATAIARETDVNFASFLTALGYTTSSFGPFTSGSVGPLTGDSSSLGPGSTIGFTFGPPDSNKIAPGQTSFVFVISTNATLFTSGNASIIDGGTQTLAAFQPLPGSQVGAPEPSTLVLLSSAALALVGRRRRKLS